MPEGIALRFLFFAYLAGFLIVCGFVARTLFETKRLEGQLEQLRAMVAETPGAEKAEAPQIVKGSR